MNENNSREKRVSMNPKDWNTKDDNPKLFMYEKQDGMASLYLLYNLGYDKITGKSIRRREPLKLEIYSTPRNKLQRDTNQDTLRYALSIKNERQTERSAGYTPLKAQNTNLYSFLSNYIEKRQIASIRLERATLNNFQEFIRDEYPQFEKRITPHDLDKDMMTDFARYLEKRHKGEGANSYWKRFKAMMNYCVEHNLMKENPCKGIRVTAPDNIFKKDILSEEELITLFNTHYNRESPVVRRAFALTCFTGIRHYDLALLTWGDVDFANKILSFRQSKTAHSSAASGVIIPLNDNLLSIIGERPKEAKDNDLIFPTLPTDAGCNKALRCWTEKAGIKKHITWHSGRHSFGTLAISNGANIKVVGELLGHASLRYTSRYLRAADKLKKEAINSFPKINTDNI